MKSLYYTLSLEWCLSLRFYIANHSREECAYKQYCINKIYNRLAESIHIFSGSHFIRRCYIFRPSLPKTFYFIYIFFFQCQILSLTLEKGPLENNCPAAGTEGKVKTVLRLQKCQRRKTSVGLLTIMTFTCNERRQCKHKFSTIFLAVQMHTCCGSRVLLQKLHGPEV